MFANKPLRTIAHSPVLWGMLAAVAFYTPLHTGAWNDPFVHRYFAGHIVEHVATTLFFVGISALVIKAIGLRAQMPLFGAGLLDPIPAGGQNIAHCKPLLARLEREADSAKHSYLVRRLHAALEYVERKGSADRLDDELHTLSDLDVAEMQHSYALVRIIIWAIPILGLLGTVIGITAAVANLSPQLLESSISNVTAGLGVAFDHTALALGLSIGLMFSQFFVERYENHLVALVDARVSAELVGRFEQAAATADPQVATVRRVAETFLQTTEKLLVRQTELWKASIDATHRQWSDMMSAARQQLEGSLSGALSQSLTQHAAKLAEAEQAHTEKNRRAWAELQGVLLQTAETATVQQRELARQGDVLLQVVEATGQIAKLESELNRNLAGLAGAKSFEEMVMSLSAAIHLLSARLGNTSHDVPRVELKTIGRTGQAA